MTPAAVSIFMGMTVILTSACIGLHEILLSPSVTNYPNARNRVRAAMFVVSVAFLYRGAEIIYNAIQPEPRYVTFGASLGTLAMAVASALQLEQTLRQWLPARIQRRIHQLIELASCKRRADLVKARERQLAAVRPGVPRSAPNATVVGPALAELAMSGVAVAGPNESSESVFPPPGWEGPR